MEERAVVQELSRPIYESRGWMRLLGGVMFAQGVLAIFTIIGIVVCWLPIWLGILLFRAAGLIEVAHMSGDKAQLLEAQQKIRMYFTVMGVLMLIMLILLGVMLLAFGSAMLATMREFGC